ncbi:hypothetical protein TWF730_003514 [Orbilia blumenaviensis]|uniref:Zn(2)-C6 fungal-type domain-containing protein n=1 Tax=Orbilia blumenaviensis TaxID=1796055 RepID=A0AAV9U6W2_9PEZI
MLANRPKRATGKPYTRPRFAQIIIPHKHTVRFSICDHHYTEYAFEADADNHGLCKCRRLDEVIVKMDEKDRLVRCFGERLIRGRCEKCNKKADECTLRRYNNLRLISTSLVLNNQNAITDFSDPNSPSEVSRTRGGGLLSRAAASTYDKVCGEGFDGGELEFYVTSTSPARAEGGEQGD